MAILKWGSSHDIQERLLQWPSSHAVHAVLLGNTRMQDNVAVWRVEPVENYVVPYNYPGQKGNLYASSKIDSARTNLEICSTCKSHCHDLNSRDDGHRAGSPISLSSLRTLNLMRDGLQGDVSAVWVKTNPSQTLKSSDPSSLADLYCTYLSHVMYPSGLPNVF